MAFLMKIIFVKTAIRSLLILWWTSQNVLISSWDKKLPHVEKQRQAEIARRLAEFHNIEQAAAEARDKIEQAAAEARRQDNERFNILMQKLEALIKSSKKPEIVWSR